MPSGGCALLSKVFHPTISRPWKTLINVDMISNSQRLMLDCGLIEYSGAKGLYHYLPLGIRSLNKLMHIIREEMDALDAGELVMSSLCDRVVWEKSGRWSQVRPDLFNFTDRRGRQLLLCPTHEESITHLMSRIRLNQSRLPLLLYQITMKFRDEANPRFGLARTREFFMKDLYSFDADEQRAQLTYDQVHSAYRNIFKRIPVDVKVVKAEVGNMGGSLSHEYHLPSSSGEDRILLCHECGNQVSDEFNAGQLTCSVCNADMELLRSHEIAHTFILGTKYSLPLKAMFFDTLGISQRLHMGCYGIGISRLLASLIDVLSERDKIHWPINIAPFKVCIVPPKAGSHEAVVSALAMDIANDLNKLDSLHGDVICDDRTDRSVGWRLRAAQKMGYPYVVVVNKSALLKPVPMFELHETISNQVSTVSHADLFGRLSVLQ